MNFHISNWRNWIKFSAEKQKKRTVMAHLSVEVVQSIYQFFSKTLQQNSLRQIDMTNGYYKLLWQIVKTKLVNERISDYSTIQTESDYFKGFLVRLFGIKYEIRRINGFLEILYLCQNSTFFNNLTRKYRHNKKTGKKRRKKDEKKTKKRRKKDEKKTKKRRNF